MRHQEGKRSKTNDEQAMCWSWSLSWARRKQFAGSLATVAQFRLSYGQPTNKETLDKLVRRPTTIKSRRHLQTIALWLVSVQLCGLSAFVEARLLGWLASAVDLAEDTLSIFASLSLSIFHSLTLEPFSSPLAPF